MLSETLFIESINPTNERPSLGQCHVERLSAYYYGQVRFQCDDIHFHDYVHLIEKYKCDMLCVISLLPRRDRFRFDYAKIPSIESIVSLRFGGLMGTVLDPEWDMVDLHNFSNLQSLSSDVFPPDKRIEFSGFTKLTRLECSYDGLNRDWLGCSNLKTISLSNFREKDLTKFDSLINIERLALRNTTIKSLAGVEKMNKLEVLFIDQARSLSDFETLLDLPRLKHLWLGSHIRNSDWKFLTAMKQLKSLHVNKAADLGFIMDLPDLSFFTLGHRAPAGCYETIGKHPGIAAVPTDELFPFRI